MDGCTCCTTNWGEVTRCEAHVDAHAWAGGLDRQQAHVHIPHLTLPAYSFFILPHATPVPPLTLCPQAHVDFNSNFLVSARTVLDVVGSGPSLMEACKDLLHVGVAVGLGVGNRAAGQH